MKPLERIFFQACWMCCSHQVDTGTDIIHTPARAYPRDILGVFIILGFPQKLLVSYLYKWDDKGFFEYGVSPNVGWFVDKNLIGEYKDLAQQAERFDAQRPDSLVGTISIIRETGKE